MIYPPEVQKKIDVLQQYTASEALNRFDILHLYKGELAYPDGYYDSYFFQLVGYNTETTEKRDLGTHDGIRFDGCEVYAASIFADGAYLLRFKYFVEMQGPNLQCVYIGRCEE